MKNNWLVSVIVPVYKVEKFLDDCIGSLINQTYEKLEIILIDDGSPDNCPEKCDQWAEQDSRIRVVHQENQGLPGARNTGLQVASGKYILYIDSDDRLDIRGVEGLVRGIEETHADLSMLAFESIPEDSKAKTDAAKETLRIEEYDREAYKRLRQGYFCWGTLYKRELIESYRLRFDPTLKNLEDVYWNACYLPHVKRIAYLKNIRYYYRNRMGSITSRCTDRAWQINSWIAVGESLVKETAQLRYHPTAEQKAVFVRFRRTIYNNIYAEAYAGRLKIHREQLKKCRLGARFVIGAAIPLYAKLAECAAMCFPWLEGQKIYEALFWLKALMKDGSPDHSDCSGL